MENAFERLNLWQERQGRRRRVATSSPSRRYLVAVASLPRRRRQVRDSLFSRSFVLSFVKHPTLRPAAELPWHTLGASTEGGR